MAKKNGNQNFLCRNCKKQFQHEYLYRGADPDVRRLMQKMLLRGSSLSDISTILLLSMGTILRFILNFGKSIQIIPQKTRYQRVQIDEMGSFVQKKKKKVWILYAYCSDSKEILAVTMGKRNKARIKDLLKRLQNIEIDFFATDGWQAFKSELPYLKHLIGKKYTKGIEGRNTWIRRRMARLFRRSTTFSKRLTYHWVHFKILVFALQNKLSYI